MKKSGGNQTTDLSTIRSARSVTANERPRAASSGANGDSCAYIGGEKYHGDWLRTSRTSDVASSGTTASRGTGGTRRLVLHSSDRSCPAHTTRENTPGTSPARPSRS